MVLDQTANFVRGTVSASIASGDTTISVTDASIYPDPATDEYNLVLWDTNQGRPDQDSSVEVVRVTGRDTTNDTLTVSRGQEGTSDVSHPDSSALLLDATDKLLSDVDTSLEAIADFAASPTEVTAPVNNDSVTTQSVSSDQIIRDYSQTRPSQPRQPEFAGGFALKNHPSVSNPVLTASDVSDEATAEGVADPFIVHEGGKFHMFFEVLTTDPHEHIGHATSPDGFDWTYDQVVIDDGSNHLAYPFVFKWDGTWYMTPDRAVDIGDFEIWSADSFPTSWSKVETAITTTDNGGNELQDPTPVFWNDRWYVFAADGGVGEKTLWYADSTGRSFTANAWSEHPSSPIISSATGVRNGGRPLVYNEYIDMIYQDDNNEPTRAYRVTDLSTTSFSQTELTTSPIWRRTDSGWNSDKAHHADIMASQLDNPPIAAVDGRDGVSRNWKIGIGTVTDHLPIIAHGEKSDQTISSGGGWTSLTWDTKDFDYGQSIDLTNNVWTAPVSGLYEIHLSVLFDNNSNATGDRRIRVINDTDGEELATGRTNPGEAAQVTCEATTKEYLDQGDSVGFDAFQDSGADMFVLGSLTLFTIELVDF